MVVRMGTDDSARARRELLAIVAHDLRNPLGSIVTVVGLLRRLRCEEPDKLTRYADILERAAERMNREIESLCDLSALEVGELPLAQAVQDPAALLQRAVEALTAAAAAKSLDLAAPIDGAPPPVRCDPERMHEVLTTLIGSAIKQTPAGGQVVAAVARQAAEVVFSITDAGNGFTVEQRAELLGHPWYARGSGGPGVELALACALVAAQGGRVWIDSEAGAGATFHVALPAAA
jgi:signal transduction histidine kinase